MKIHNIFTFSPRTKKSVRTIYINERNHAKRQIPPLLPPPSRSRQRPLQQRRRPQRSALGPSSPRRRQPRRIWPFVPQKRRGRRAWRGKTWSLLHPRRPSSLAPSQRQSRWRQRVQRRHGSLPDLRFHESQTLPVARNLRLRLRKTLGDSTTGHSSHRPR